MKRHQSLFRKTTTLDAAHRFRGGHNLWNWKILRLTLPLTLLAIGIAMLQLPSLVVVFAPAMGMWLYAVFVCMPSRSSVLLDGDTIRVLNPFAVYELKASEVTAFQTSFSTAKPGCVSLVDGQGRVTCYGLGRNLRWMGSTDLPAFEEALSQLGGKVSAKEGPPAMP